MILLYLRFQPTRFSRYYFHLKQTDRPIHTTSQVHKLILIVNMIYIFFEDHKFKLSNIPPQKTYIVDNIQFKSNKP